MGWVSVLRPIERRSRKANESASSRNRTGNTGLITNLPDGCTVELPCIVDSNGIQPTFIGDLPSQCAATCSASVNVQRMAVEAAITGDRNLAKLAVLHDPLTSAILTPDQVWSMCDDLLAALRPWLPQFRE